MATRTGNYIKVVPPVDLIGSGHHCCTNDLLFPLLGEKDVGSTYKTTFQDSFCNIKPFLSHLYNKHGRQKLNNLRLNPANKNNSYEKVSIVTAKQNVLIHQYRYIVRKHIKTIMKPQTLNSN